MSAGTSAALWLLFVSIVFVSAEQKIITADPGQNVTLTCRAPSNDIRVIEWRRPDLKPEFVLLNRDGQSDPDDLHPSFRNRVDLQDKQMKDGNVSVILKNVMINDTGTYMCRVFVGETGSWKSIKNITLSVVPAGPGGGAAGLMVGLPVFSLLVVAVGFAV
ncbi:coxsackievirus and adenovirus receptor-like [Archocentrus centrarchus]|uniref:coxsackievirus and adenovirus receptor-like n=1 Tax=Archocentrus centrarchus TaxID=63155 RepID=UPI0011E9E41B|nr:coxsackievirus and adenovirus receptor-like [Archocentrus centrarchus]